MKWGLHKKALSFDNLKMILLLIWIPLDSMNSVYFNCYSVEVLQNVIRNNARFNRKSLQSLNKVFSLKILMDLALFLFLSHWQNYL